MKLEPSDIEGLKPVLAAFAAELMGEVDKLPNDRLGFPEAESAALLGVPKHTLRDARLRGELAGARVGKKIVYRRDELIRFLIDQERSS